MQALRRRVGKLQPQLQGERRQSSVLPLQPLPSPRSLCQPTPTVRTCLQERRSGPPRVWVASAPTPQNLKFSSLAWDCGPRGKEAEPSPFPAPALGLFSPHHDHHVHRFVLQLPGSVLPLSSRAKHSNTPQGFPETERGQGEQRQESKGAVAEAPSHTGGWPPTPGPPSQCQGTRAETQPAGCQVGIHLTLISHPPPRRQVHAEPKDQGVHGDFVTPPWPCQGRRNLRVLGGSPLDPERREPSPLHSAPVRSGSPETATWAVSPESQPTCGRPALSHPASCILTAEGQPREGGECFNRLERGAGRSH